MHIKTLESIDEIQSIKQDWDELYNKTDEGLFIHHSWVYHHYRTFKQKPLVIVFYNDAKQLIAAFPLTIKPFKIKSFSFMALCHGISAATDYSRFLIDPQANRRLIIKRLIQHLLEIQNDLWYLYKFDNLSDANENCNLFRHLLLKELYGGEATNDVTPMIDLSATYEEAKKASNIRRRFRKIANECEIDHKYGKEILEQDMQEFSTIHQRSFPNAAFDTTTTQEFYRALIEDNEFGKYVILSCIRKDQQIVASHFGFTDNRVFYYYVPTYDEAFANYGAGQYLLRNLVEMCREKNHQIFDLLRGNEDYKYNWANKFNNNISIICVKKDAPLTQKLLINLWLLTRTLPFFTH